jgi:hypothetical protein
VANVKSIANAFLDGFGSLGFLFWPAVRPGSRENLISQAATPLLDPNFMDDVVLRRSADIRDVVVRLRKTADLIESRQEGLRQAMKEAGTLHGQ